MRIFGLIALLITAARVYGQHSPQVPMSEFSRQVTAAVARKFSIPANTSLAVLEREKTAQYRRVTVFSTTPGYPFEKDLHILHDRYVYEAVGDLTETPEVAASKAATNIVQRLQTDDSPRLGSATAPVALVMYSDFQCGFCRAAHRLLQERLSQDNKLQLIFKHYPLRSHDWSGQAARHATCLYKQSNAVFWRFADFVFANQSVINPYNLDDRIREFLQGVPEVDQQRLRQCTASTEPDAAILRDQNSAVATGVSATPTFIDGQKIVGMGDEGGLLQLLDRREQLVSDGGARKAVESR